MGTRSVVVVLGFFMAVPLSGCPVGAELENPERFVAAQGGAAGAGTMGGGAGMAGASGSVGGAGAAGAAGTGGGVTFIPPDCDYRGALARSCAKVACHQISPSFPRPAAGLDLKTDGIEARLFGQPPTYTDISCDNPDGGALPITCVPSGCAQDALLIKPGDAAQSFLFKKIAGTHGDCGVTMPPGKLDPADRTCIEAWITAVAAGH